jgi:hypothetical protein
MSFDAFKKVPAALDQAEAEESGVVWIQAFEPADDTTLHELVFFIKPELLLAGAGIDYDAVLGFLAEKLGAYDMSLGSLAVLSAKYLKAHGIMQSHYGVINKISREGEAGISSDAKAKLAESFADQIAAGAQVLGGHQILDKFSNLTPAAFNEIWETKRSTKLAGGTYANDIEVEGQAVIALNGFHPDQIDHFVGDGRRIVVATVRSSRPWADLRSKLIGATDPTVAEAGSIRAELLARKADFGLAEVNQGFNGVHLSAGPLEGLVELVRFTSDRAAGTDLALDQTCFGRALANAGLPEPRIRELMDNPDLDDAGKQVSAFDLTEEANAADALVSLT